VKLLKNVLTLATLSIEVEYFLAIANTILLNPTKWLSIHLNSLRVVDAIKREVTIAIKQSFQML